MTARDPLIHGRKTTMGIDLTFGATTTTPCGKTRPRERTSSDPATVTCWSCRGWAAREERQMADIATAAASAVREHPEYADLMPAGCTAEGFEAVAAAHLVSAAVWEMPPGRFVNEGAR